MIAGGVAGRLRLKGEARVHPAPAHPSCGVSRAQSLGPLPWGESSPGEEAGWYGAGNALGRPTPDPRTPYTLFLTKLTLNRPR